MWKWIELMSNHVLCLTTHVRFPRILRQWCFIIMFRKSNGVPKFFERWKKKVKSTMQMLWIRRSIKMIDHYFPTLVDLSLKAFYESVKECIKHPETVISFGDCVFLPEKITEKLITSLSSNGILNSRTLAFFNHKNTRLK